MTKTEKQIVMQVVYSLRFCRNEWEARTFGHRNRVTGVRVSVRTVFAAPAYIRFATIHVPVEGGPLNRPAMIHCPERLFFRRHCVVRAYEELVGWEKDGKMRDAINAMSGGGVLL